MCDLSNLDANHRCPGVRGEGVPWDYTWRGGVYFKGHMGRANRVLGCPSRILWVRGKFKAYDFETLRTGIKQVELAPFSGFTVHASSSKSKLYHSDAVRECVESALPRGDTGLYVRIHRDQVMVSIDTTGDLLYRRGWRLENGRRPSEKRLRMPY